MVFKTIAEEHGVSPLIHFSSYGIVSTSMVKGLVGENEGMWITFFDNSRARFSCDVEEYTRQGKLTLAKLEDPSFHRLLDEKSRSTIAALSEYASTLKEKDFSVCSDAQLSSAFEELYQLFVDMNVYGCIVNYPDFEHNLFSNRLLSILERKSASPNAKTSVAEAFGLLATSVEKSVLQQQDEDFFSLLSFVSGNPGLRKLFAEKDVESIASDLHLHPEFQTQLAEHVGKYDWMQFHYDGPTLLGEAYFLELLKAELAQGTDAGQTLEELKKKPILLAEKQKRISEEFGLSEREEYWFEVARSFSFLKSQRKDTVFYAQRCAEGLLAEISRRLGVSVKQLKHLTHAELLRAIESRVVDGALLQQRVESCILVSTAGTEQVLVGEKALEYVKMVEQKKDVEGVNELKGTPACVGFARGIVKLVAKAEDMAKMKKGDILISPATNPNLVPAMRKAAAIVTDEGGITCHAAIVSRELGIPCVVGTKIVTHAFKDGDLVEVDAVKGIIRRVS